MWVFSITTRRFSQLKKRVSDTRYAYLAAGGEIIVYGSNAERELTIFSTQTLKSKGTITVDHPVGNMVLFPGLSRLAIDAFDAIILYDTRDWTVVNKIELSEPLGYSLTSDSDSSLFAFLNGNVMYANTLYVCEASTGQVVLRQVSPRARPFNSIAIVRGGGAVVTCQGDTIIIFQRCKRE
jgi:hypothetical protein